MEKLMKPVEYAQELGISRQAVYAKIKRGILKAKNVEGKLYIVVDKIQESTPTKATTTPSTKARVTTKSTSTEGKDYKALLEAKDETISVLKGTVKDLKKSNKQISTTLKGEIDLLKEAFHEMRSLYVLQLEQKKPVEEVIEVEEDISIEEDTGNWISLKKFFKLHKIVKEKQQEKVIKRLSKAFKKEDERLRNVDGKVKLNADAKYKDILK
jgi:transcriptional regulator of acetoin/glycerol metabolism